MRGQLTAVIEVASANNDPIAVILTVALINLLTQARATTLGILSQFFREMILRALLGYRVGTFGSNTSASTPSSASPSPSSAKE